MYSQRNIIVITLLFVFFMIWKAWEMENTSKSNIKNEKYAYNSEIQTGKIIRNKEKLLTINTDVLSLTINTKGGDIEKAKLLIYRKKLDSTMPFTLLETSPSFVYQAQSGITGDGPDNGQRPQYKVEKNIYTLADGEKEISVPLTYKDKKGSIYTKTFLLKRNNYAVNMNYTIDNKSTIPLKLTLFFQLKQTIEIPKENGNRNLLFHTFRGAAYSSNKEKYKKYEFDNKENIKIKTNRGWVAMLQQYFATAWIIPEMHSKKTVYTKNVKNNIFYIGLKTSPVVINPSAQKKINASLWIGPELQEEMAKLAPNLNFTVDYGWFWFISQPLLKFMKMIHGFISNWGVSIILITFILRAIMYPLSKAQYTSMEKMRKLQQKIQDIRDRIDGKKDKNSISKEIIALYKYEKMNPLIGCIPFMIQMPIFLALYYMLRGSVELRHAPFALWINDLSAPDPKYILPILMGMTMFCIQKWSTNKNRYPIQKKISILIPILFTVFFFWFPSGLVLYYIVSNLVTIIQKKFIYLSLEKMGIYKKK